jgi:hypothetical protein
VAEVKAAPPAEKKRQWKSLKGILAGKSNLPTDIIDTTHLWNAVRGEGLDY